MAALDQKSTLATSTGGAFSSRTTTFGTNPAAGGKCLVGIFNFGSGAPTSVTDNAGNSYTADQSLPTQDSARIFVYRADNITLPGAGNLAVTVAFSGNTFFSCQAFVYTGVAAGGPNGTNSGFNSSAQTTGSSGAAGGASTALHFCVLALHSSGTVTMTPGGSFTKQGEETDGATNFTGAIADLLDAAASTSCTWTFTNNVWYIGIVAYDAGGPAAGPPVRDQKTLLALLLARKYFVRPNDQPPTGPAVFPLSLDGSVSPTGSLTKQDNKNYAGAITPAGVAAKQTSKLLAGTVTPAGTAIKQLARAFAGTVTSAGSLVKQVNKALAGSVSPSGTLVKRVDKLLAGAISSSGSNTKQVNKNLGGASSPSGSLTTIRIVLRSFSGAVSPVGSLIKTKLTLLSGSLTPQGSLLKSCLKLFSGAITPSATLTNVRVVLRNFAGSITPSGLLSKSTLLRPTGSSSPTGTLLKQVTKLLAGSSSPAGVLTRAVTRVRSFGGTISSAGSLTKQVQKVLTATISSTGTVRKVVNKSFAASTGPTGDLQRSRTVLRSFSGTVTITGQASIAAISGAAAEIGVKLMAIRYRVVRMIRTLLPEWTQTRHDAVVTPVARAVWFARTHRVLKMRTGQGGSLQEGQHITMPPGSVEYVWITVESEVDPTGGAVSVAMTPVGTDPVSGDFKSTTVSWVTGESQPSIDQYVCRFLAGSGTFPLAADSHYNVHVKISAGLETPVIYAGQLHTT